MSTITIGPGAVSGNDYWGGDKSLIVLGYTASGTGVLDTFEAYSYQKLSAPYIGTAYLNSGTTYYTRDYERVGDVETGGKRTFTGRNCSVTSGDYICCYGGGKAGQTSWAATSPSGTSTITRHNGPNGSNNLTSGGGDYPSSEGDTKVSIYATGKGPPDAPTNVSASENDSSKVTITWTAGVDEENGHRVYRDGNDISGVVSHGTNTYDDTTADAPVITSGTSSASDGTFNFKVISSNSGESIKNGTTYSYTVKAINSVGTSSASSADNGYRLAGSLSYQWQISTGDFSPVEAYINDWDIQPASVANTTINSCSGGILDVTSTSGDPMIDMPSLGSFSTSVYKYLNIRYKVVSGTAGHCQIYFYNTEYPTANEANRVNGTLISDNTWHILSIDMSAHENWLDSNVTGWRYDWCVANSVNMQLDYISLTNSQYRWEDIAGATSSTFTFYDAPSGVGRYYRCKLTASNSKTQYSTAERGYRVLLTPIVII